jgi:hypothetical protein
MGDETKALPPPATDRLTAPRVAHTDKGMDIGAGWHAVRR